MASKQDSAKDTTAKKAGDGSSEMTLCSGLMCALSWLFLCPVWNFFLTRTALGRFINAHLSHTLNLLVAHVLFWAIAIPQVTQTGVSYMVGYKQSLELNKDAPNGKIQTGRFGSGAFPMVFIVTFMATILWFKHLYQWVNPPKEEEEDE